MISLEKKFLFVHIQKTAGNSIQQLLKNYSEDELTIRGGEQDGFNRFGVESKRFGTQKHSTISDYKAAIPKHLYRQLLKFTVVRNPWDRAISFFFHRNRDAARSSDANSSEHRFDVFPRDEFLKFACSIAPLAHFVCARDLRYRIASRMSAWSPTFDLNPLRFSEIDFFLRYEHLQRDFNSLCTILDLPMQELPRVNRSDHLHYSSYYDADMYRLVATRFRHEIEHFRYDFAANDPNQR